ncbi:MAG TPA: phosphate ABC transporter substrate-binding protein [Coriobacteriia bacterium]
MRRIVVALAGTALMLAGLLALSGCAASTTASTTQLTVTGSTTLLPIAEVSAEDFMAANSGTRVLVSGVGSSAGIESVTNGTCDIGTSSRELKPAELSLGLVDTPVARDAIAVIVNPGNPVTSLNTSQVADIFSGKVRNWKEVGGPDLEIGLVNRDEASGTRQAFLELVMKGRDFDPTAAVLPGTGQVRSVVAQSRIAVGYISLGFVDSSVKAIVIDGVAPTPATVADKSYPVSRVLHFLTKGEPQGLAKQFIDYVLSPTIQDSVVPDAGFLPMSAGVK